MRKLLQDLSYEDYVGLLKMGLLWEIYPNATGDWDIDRR